MIGHLQPDAVVCAFDCGKPTFRLEIIEKYKAQRPPTDERLRAQFPLLEELLCLLRVPVVKLEGWEGDDILGTLSAQAEEHGMRTYLASGDKDIYQLITETTSVVTSAAGRRSEIVLIDPQEVVERYGVRCDQIVDFLGLKGDPSDNIPGVRGIGEKTAAKLLGQFGTLEEIITAAKDGEISGSVATKLIDGEDTAYASRTVATIVRDVPLELDIETVEWGRWNSEEVYEAFEVLHIRSPLERLMTFHRTETEPIRASVVSETQKVDVETPMTVPAAEPTSTEADTPEIPDDFDCSLAAYLLNSTQSKYDLSTLTHQYLGKELPAQTSLLEPTLDESEVRAELVPVLVEKLVAEDMWELYTTIELPLKPILTQMEKTGVALDTNVLDALAAEGRAQLNALTAEIYELAGHPFSLDSPKQLSAVLFDEIGLSPTRKTRRTGYSTDAATLEGLVDVHPIVRKIMAYRELAKLQSTYLEALPRLIGADGKLHTHFNQTVTATGRLSSSNPNLQNIPVRTELGRRVREAFIPSETGWLMLSADYSQIELRVLAHLSEDRELIAAFTDGEDFHAETAARIFGVNSREVTSEMRFKAKAVNFGIVYGQSMHGLAQALGISKSEAKEMIDRYYAAYPQVDSYLHQLVEQAQRQGWVATAFGRRRYIPEVTAPVHKIREFGKRTAMNHPMQGTAADLIKLAMMAVDKQLREGALEARMLLQVHDELIFEAPETEIEALSGLVIDAMTHVAKLHVPLEVSISIGSNWAET